MGIASDFTYGMSPEEDDLHGSLFDDGDDDLGSSLGQVMPKRKSSSAQARKGPQGADKRATHNAIERARRESLNGRFMTLAEALPSMAKVKRPSKSVIVNKALDFVFEAQVKEHALVKENNELRREVDSLRRQLGLPPLPPPSSLTTDGARLSKKSALSRQASGVSNSFESAIDLANSMSHLDTNATSPTQSSSAGDRFSPATSSFPSPPSMKLETVSGTGSPGLSYPASMPTATSMFANAGSPTASLSDPSDSFSVASQLSTSAPHNVAAAHAAASSPFAMHQHQMALGGLHAQGLMPAATAAQFGYLTPAMLQSQQNTMLFAAALQQQQQQQQQHQQAQQIQQFDLYGVNSTLMGGPWGATFPGHT